MKIISLILSVCFFLTSCSFATPEQQEAYKNDYLYSEAYFDYLIECAEKEKYEQEEQLKKQKSKKQKDIVLDEIIEDENTLPKVENEDEYIAADLEPFKLRIIEHSKVTPYSESYKPISAKTVIPVTSAVSFVQNMTTSRNKYSSNDFKILVGAEYSPFKHFKIATGLETNYRGIDQAPSSRKLYLSPGISFGDKFSLVFPNKVNINSYSTDHDIGLNVSPFKSKALDFGVYAGITRSNSGSISESVNFLTTFYFF